MISIEYFCKDCKVEGSFTEVAWHRIKSHDDDQLKIQKRVLNHVTGKIARKEFNFEVLPKDVKRVNGKFKIHEIIESIDIECCPKKSANSIQTRKDIECQTESYLNDGSTQTDQSDVAESSETPLVATSIKLLPAVCAFLSKQDPLHSARFVELMTLMASGEFPLSNICYRLFLDLVHYHLFFTEQ